MTETMTAGTRTTKPKIVSRAEWVAARVAHLEQEKALTRAYDELTRQRRELPWVRVDTPYVFDGPEGPTTLADLFRGNSQLLVQHFMLAPGWGEGCTGCSFMADHVDGARQHFEHHDVSFAAVSRAPLAEIAAYKKRMGWTFPWVSSFHNDFNYDFHVSFTDEEVASKKGYYNYAVRDLYSSEMPGLSVFIKDDFIKDGGQVFHTYSSYGRGNETLIGAYQVLDMTPNGRAENGPGYNLMDWVKRHDRYKGATDTPACCR